MNRISTLVICSADCVASNKHKSIEKAFADHESITIKCESVEILLSEKARHSLPVQNPMDFCKGAVSACLVDSGEPIDFAMILKALKLTDTDIYHTADPFFIAKLSMSFYPQKKTMEQTVMVCSPPLSEQHREAIFEELALKGVFILSHREVGCGDQPILIQALSNNAEDVRDDEECSIILCEALGAVNEITLSIGCQNDDDLCQLSQKWAPESWNAKYSEHGYRFGLISSLDLIERLCPNVPMERTLALIKPTAVSKGYVGDIVEAMEQHGFTIISRKRVHLKPEHAQHFYGEHAGKPFYEELTTFMASGPIHAFILERRMAIKCWRTLLGPTNTQKAQEKAPQSLRARYGSDQTANACHGSDSGSSAEREIRFYFPEIGMVMSGDEEEKRGSNLVEEYMAQKLGNNETLKEFLVRGLSELAKQKPGSKLQVVEWFAHWLRDNNPSKPTVQEPSEPEEPTPDEE